MDELSLNVRQKKQDTRWLFLLTLLKNKVALTAIIFLMLFMAMAIFAEQLAPRDPLKTSDYTLQPPSQQFWFGTDDLGRDVFSGVIHGARTSISIGVIDYLLSSLLGLAVGLIAGYAGNLIDDLLMRLTELFLIPPRFFLILIIAAIYGATYFNLILVLSVTLWPLTARLVRAEVLSVKNRGFVEAARAIGANHWRILLREILPSVLPIIITNAALKVGTIILLEASVEFLGLGDANHISWGYMLHSGQHYMRDGWWIVVFPSIAISLLILALNLISDELNKVLDPKLSRGTF
jgi:peptide/nickel transport system permease protein